jgi:hypothetical protein
MALGPGGRDFCFMAKAIHSIGTYGRTFHVSRISGSVVPEMASVWMTASVFMVILPNSLFNNENG